MRPNRVSEASGPAGAAQGSLLVQLRHLRTDLPPTARRIADYLVTHVADVVRMSITEVAEKTDASEGSVISLCRRIGASGFQELKILLARDLVEPVRFIQEDLVAGDDVETVTDRIFAAHGNSLAETRKLLSLEALGRAVELISRAERVEVYGIGSSGPIACDCAYRLLQVGIKAQAIVESHVQAVSAVMTGPSVTTITISHSGSTIETVLATRLAKQAGARTIGVTRLGKCPLERHCDVVLNTVANETRFRPEAMSSRVAQLALIDVLVSAVAMVDPERAVGFLEKSARAIAEKRY